MSKAAVFLATGFEEIEAVTPIDILRRGGVDVETVSLTGELVVKGSHGMELKADLLFTEIQRSTFDMIILPGGSVGTANYLKHEQFLSYVEEFYSAGGQVAAICAAPSVLAALGLLDGKRAVCHRSVEQKMAGAILGANEVEADGNIITSQSAATAMAFAFALLERLRGEAMVRQIKDDIMY
jgi:4-methyl-5(b-hydroxyethyl)-thiazole monophosphate biosynthesis